MCHGPRLRVYSERSRLRHIRPIVVRFFLFLFFSVFSWAFLVWDARFSGVLTRLRTIGRRGFASTSAKQADITLTVDGKEVTVPQGRMRVPGW